MIRFFLIFFTLFNIAAADSALRWDRKTVDASLAPGAKTLRAEFGFVNTSAKPVEITSTKTDCGCTVATLEKKIYQPGERGQIRVIFTPKTSKSLQTKGIRVSVKGEPEPVALTLSARIGPTLQIDPPLVFWRVGETPQAKTIRLMVPPGFKVVRVTSNNPQITCALEQEQITVTPKATNRPLMAVLTLHTVSKSDEPQQHQAYAQIK